MNKFTKTQSKEFKKVRDSLVTIFVWILATTFIWIFHWKFSLFLGVCFSIITSIHTIYFMYLFKTFKKSLRGGEHV
jgi:hypothetical protein